MEEEEMEEVYGKWERRGREEEVEGMGRAKQMKSKERRKRVKRGVEG